MAKMVKFLIAVEERVLSLLVENENHPGLQKVLNIVRMLLTIPHQTPLAKVIHIRSSSLCRLLNF